MKTHQPVSSLSEYIKTCIDLADETENLLWYRGQDNNWPLRPGIFRDVDTSDQFGKRLEEEDSMINDFYIQSPLEFGRVPKDGWEWLATMQHRRLPTRLLDWSENMLQALFFALHKWNPKLEHTPLVYIIDPCELNKQSAGEAKIYITDNHRLTNWLPNTLRFFQPTLNLQDQEIDIKKDSGFPVAVYTQHIDQRIRHQKGSFTLHGNFYLPLEKPFSNLIQAIPIDLKDYTAEEKADLRYDLLTDLNRCGVNEYTTYGDLDSISEYLTRFHINRNY